ncbi:MAG: hypothetical protein HY367_03185 [Candidatus Aenigmarchaeota archaeon]|nr:hypothetical protein [Candidatus Aenigmarchaeota archaeon]
MHRGIKGQIEFAVILGVVVVAVVVIIFAFSGNFNPVSPDQRAVMDSAENMIRQGTLETIRTLGEQGGYLDQNYPQGSVAFNGQRVPYWELNGNVAVPDIRSNLAAGITRYLEQNKGALQSSYRFAVSFGQPQVSVNLLNDKAEVTVSMPTTVKGDAVPQPYRVSVPTMFGEAVDFSTKYVEYANRERPLETFTISSMLLSPLDASPTGPVQGIPTVIALTQCGQAVHKDYNSIGPEMENAIRRTLARTYLPGKYVTHEEAASSYTRYTFNDAEQLAGDFETPFIDRSVTSPQYSLAPIGGKDYNGISVSFWLPDGFALNRNNFAFTPDPIDAVAEPIPLAGICQSDPVYVKYSLNYPAIVRSRDPVTGSSLQFANSVFIKDNKPGQWSDTSLYQAGAQAELCSNPLCAADIRVQDTLGRPLASAGISFLGCAVGETDSQGRFAGKVPCGLGVLQAGREGYDTFGDVVSSSDLLGGVAVVLPKKPSFTLDIQEVNVRDESLAEQYRINPIDISALGSTGGRIVHMAFLPSIGSQPFERFIGDQHATISGIPTGEYTVSAVMLDRDTGAALGGFVTGFSVTEDLEGKEVNMYLPYLFAFSQQADEERIASMIKMDILFRNPDCGLGPLSTAEAGFDGCVVKYGDVI